MIAVHSPRHIWSNSPRRDGLSYSWQLLAASADNDFQLLVLGRPGSGTTSLLKVLSNTREEFRDVSGDVFYGNAGAKEARQFRHQIVMNTEEDLHFPTLKVGETLDFASSSKLPGTRPEHLQKRKAYTSDKKGSILNSLSIAHTSETVVGD